MEAVLAPPTVMSVIHSSMLDRLLDKSRCPGSGVASADGIVHLLRPSRGNFAASRHAYSARPFDHHAPAADPGAFERGLSPLARGLAETMPRTGAVLDVGCGAGHTTAWLSSLGVPMVAVDQSAESLRRLLARVATPAVEADAIDLPFKDAQFDGVLADGVIHHTVRPALALREVVRVLRPGGLLFVRVYRAESIYPASYRLIGGLLRFLVDLSPLDKVVWRVAYPAYRRLADRRYRRRGEPAGIHDEGVFSDYFLTPRATPMRASSLHGTLRRLGLEILRYEAYRNVHGFLARKRGARPS